MYRIAKLALVTTLLVVLSTFVVGGSAQAAPLLTERDLPSCLNHTWTGTAGRLSVQTATSGRISWGVYDFTDNDGTWVYEVWVGKKKVDGQTKPYNPHGSVNPADAIPGQVLRLDITHTYPNGQVSHNVPNGCVIPRAG